MLNSGPIDGDAVAAGGGDEAVAADAKGRCCGTGGATTFELDDASENLPRFMLELLLLLLLLPLLPSLVLFLL